MVYDLVSRRTNGPSVQVVGSELIAGKSLSGIREQTCDIHSWKTLNARNLHVLKVEWSYLKERGPLGFTKQSNHTSPRKPL